MKKNIGVYGICFVLLNITSCQEQEEYEKTATIKFDISEATYQENIANVKIGLTLDHVRNENVIIKASLNRKDTATYREIDFGITPEVLIKPFNNKAYFQVSIVDDKQIDLNDQIELTLIKPQSGNIRLSNNLNEQRFSLTIENNDLLQRNQLQADLSWSRRNPADLVSLINFDLYVQTNVEINNGIVYDIGDTFIESTEFSSFETVHLKESDPDQPYYIVVYFNLTYLYDMVSYQLTLNGFGFQNKNFGGVLLDSDVGTAILYGPFYKEGNRIIDTGRKKEAAAYPLTKKQLEHLGFLKSIN